MEQIVNSKTDYLFTSERLGFRNWEITDAELQSEINADPLVMEFFPSTQTREQTLGFIDRMQKEFTEKGFCYFAVEKLENKELIGFIGIHVQTFESDFTPCIDIGWRIKSSEWNKGFATEGAKSCLEYVFSHFNMARIFSITPAVNIKSERIMQKIGMTKVKNFKFILLKDDERLEECVLYQIMNPRFRIIPYQPTFHSGIETLIQAIRNEYDLPPPPADYNPPLPENYWVTQNGDEIIGTIGVNVVKNYGVLKRFFLLSGFRGSENGLSDMMFSKALVSCKEHNLHNLYLGTMDVFKAAHKFYEKKGFIAIPISELPDDFPHNPVDTVFYQLNLK